MPSPFYPFQTNNVRNQTSCISWESLVFNQPPAWGCAPTLGTHIPPGVRHSGSARQEQVLLLLLCQERAETCSGWECGMGKWASRCLPALSEMQKFMASLLLLSKPKLSSPHCLGKYQQLWSGTAASQGFGTIPNLSFLIQQPLPLCLTADLPPAAWRALQEDPPH